MVGLKGTFFEFRHLEKTGKPFSVSKKSIVVHSDTDGYALRYIENTLDSFDDDGMAMNISLYLEIPEKIKSDLGCVYCDNCESYIIVISSEHSTVSLYSTTHRGLIYAVSTLKQLCDGNEISDMILFDYPDKAVRGYRVYTPGRKYIPKFKQMIDMLVQYKYNTLMIEVGGAMEYKRHPLINEKWIEFCNEVSVSPEAAQNIQNKMYPWMKDSIHFDNGNGSYISQDEMRDLINYCREREIEVYPEVPSLSHSDYILRAYPELNERIEDKYPDSYCPSNPKTYEVLFDIIDEVTDVFESEYVNIGHDEYYTSAKCELCRNKKPIDLYIEDIEKINNYLKTKNMKAMMWCDKLFENVVIFYDEDNPLMPFGAAPYPPKDIPAFYGCKSRIPKDITMLNWSWSHDSVSEEEELYDIGYKMVFGNYNALELNEYRRRSSIADGGFVSNWGSVEEKYMQRNIQNLSLAATAWAFWNGEYDTCDRAKLSEKVKKMLYSSYKESLGENIIELEHTTDYEQKYIPFYDGRFIVDEDWIIGNYVVTYADNTEVRLPVVFGYNIRSSNPGCTEEEYKTLQSYENMEAIGASYPYFKDGRIIYRTAFENPHPDKLVVSVEYESTHGIEVDLIRVYE